ncbi:ATP-binding protein [Streptomyces sp. 4503]|uniref:ATP-binding protein n=1 Tax=Streptomyces niphimycinicus TaxID=2842201 RepID=A0ABS6CJA5_9ACTN|nr:ATP-binding protein [Streptomyces niphimycinicus]MBU3867022.1 ATP-binding protein [Streptomyces niphimycinicus]
MTATARPSAVGAPAYSQVLPREPEAAALARRMVRTVLDTWHLPQLADDAALVTSELVANAVDHARGRCMRLTVTRAGEYRVRLAVIDKSHDEPVRKAPIPSEERGRGLAVVDAFSAAWGVDPLPWGKRVWSELEAGMGEEQP